MTTVLPAVGVRDIPPTGVAVEGKCAPPTGVPGPVVGVPERTGGVAKLVVGLPPGVKPELPDCPIFQKGRPRISYINFGSEKTKRDAPTRPNNSTDSVSNDAARDQ